MRLYQCERQWTSLCLLQHLVCRFCGRYSSHVQFVAFVSGMEISACRSLRQKRRSCVRKLPRTSCSLSRRPPIRLYVSCHPSPSARSACKHVKAAVQPSCLQHAVLSPCFLSGMSARAQTPSTAFRHLPPKEGCRKPVLGVWAEL